MKEMVDMGTRFIGFRDEAESLRSNFLVQTDQHSHLFACDMTSHFYIGALHLAQERTKELETRLEASEKARSDAEAKAATADLRVMLNAAESSLSEREEQISKREVAIIARLDTQSIRFSSNVPLSFRRPFLLAYITFIFILKSSPSFSRKNW
jgi:hypothetical protein